MKLIDKHLLKQFLPAFLYCVFAFIILYVVIDLFTNLDDMIKQHVSPAVLLRYYLSFLPIILTQVTPISVLLAILYSLGTLNKNNEIMAMKASGISVWRIIMPFLCVGFIISMCMFIVENRVVPSAFETYNTIRKEKIETGDKNKDKETIEDVTLYGNDYRIYYAEQYSLTDKELTSLLILQHNEDNKLVGRITADKAVWQDGKWLLKNCAIYSLSQQGSFQGAPAFFKEKYLDSEEGPQDFAKSKHQTQFMSIFELYRYVKKLTKNGYRPVGILVDFYNKTSFPFINLVVILIAVPFALLPNRSGAMMYIGVSVAIGFLYYATLITTVSMGKAAFLPPAVASWFANLLFAACGIIFIVKLPK